MANYTDMDTYTWVQLIMASFSILAGCTTLWILYDMNKWTGFLYLVATLSVCQMTYDIGFFFRANSEDPVFTIAWYILQCGGGLATTLMTNVIAYIVANIAMTLRSYDIKKNYMYIMAWVIGISLIPAILLAVSSSLEPHEEYKGLYKFTVLCYSIMRICSIVINFGAYLLLTIRLRRMGLSLNSKKNQPLHPVAALSSRMIYYPIVQVATRLAAAWMEFGYPTNGPGDDDSVDINSPSYKIANTLYSISGPASGLGFFFIFLFMQPAAFSHLKSKIFSFLMCNDSNQYNTNNAPAHSLKADILRESHSVCINEVDASSDDSHQTSSDMEHSPMMTNSKQYNNGQPRGLSTEGNYNIGFGRNKNQSGQGQGPGGIRSNSNTPRNGGDVSIQYGRHFSADGHFDSSHQRNNEYNDNNNNNNRWASGDGYNYDQSSQQSKRSSTTSGHSFHPSKLALLDDDELAGLVEKLANISHHTDEVRNSIAESSGDGTRQSEP
jgi:hypothetical protein